MAHRLPRYAAMAARWGVTVEAAEVAAVRDPQDFDALIAEALGAADERHDHRATTTAPRARHGHGHGHAHAPRAPAPARSASPRS